MSTPGGFDDPRTVDAEIDPGQENASPRRRPRLTRRNAELITSAQRSPAENRRSRETKYLILQGMRIPFVLLAIAAALWWQNWFLAIVFFAISIPLPWISVVIANNSNEVRDKRTQNVYKPAAARQQLALEHTRAELEAGGSGGATDPGTIDHE